MEQFNPKRLKFARERRGLTIKKLSEKLDITTRTLSDFENGRRVPLENKIDKICEILSFPKNFFFMINISELAEHAVSFRSLARMSASIRKSAIRTGEIALEFSAWLDKRYELPEAKVPDLNDCNPEIAAEVVRNHWGIGERPVSNMVHLLEAFGIRVFSLVKETTDMDALSFWSDNSPFIFLNTIKSVEHSRFDAAHELGHLTLHKHGSPTGKEAEIQANIFASAFLMPQGSVIAHTPQGPTLDTMMQLKSNWKVSLSALIRRLKDLSILTEWQYRSYNIELSKSGYLKNEPNPILERETSKMLPAIFKMLKEDGVSKNFIADELGIYVDDINEFLFNLTLTKVKSDIQPTVNKKNDKNRPNLYLVK